MKAPTGPLPFLPGFERVQRYWDATTKAWVAQVLPGEFFVSRQDEIISTVLGSCVSACVRDRRGEVGGINHFMMPFGVGGPTGASTRFGCFAIERLINEVLKHGGRRELLEVKVFGGSSVMAKLTDVGRSNVDFIRGYLQAEGIAIAAEDVGGSWARRIRYHPLTGQALVKRLSMQEGESVVRDEESLRQTLARRPASGDIEIF
jgi:chemotaxis protein CheD